MALCNLPVLQEGFLSVVFLKGCQLSTPHWRLLGLQQYM